MEALIKIQADLKAPKSQFNKHGKFTYRNAEDILEAVKPLLQRENVTLILTDDIVTVNDRFYVKATATIISKDKSISVYAFARETFERKGMDVAQITGAASSYARKYALNGLFLIDDTKDPDTTNTQEQDTTNTQDSKTATKHTLNKQSPKWQSAIEYVAKTNATISQLRKYYEISSENFMLLRKEANALEAEYAELQKTLHNE